MSTTAALPASVHDDAYVAFVEAHAGPARERPLAEDAAVLGRSLSTHEALSQVQLLAALFHSQERADACATRDLVDLDARDVDAPQLLRPLRALGPAVEVLRCAAHLEAEPHARLPPVIFDGDALEAALASLVVVAPELSRHRVAVVRSLRLRGRVLGDEIWIGAPGVAPWPSIEHVAWQAAHEATVAEVSRSIAGPHEPLERAALSTLQERAAREGLGAAHRRWRDHLAADWR